MTVVKKAVLMAGGGGSNADVPSLFLFRRS
jgi:hypothetical protein